MKIIKKYLTKNRCYTAGRKITPKGLMLHSVGTPQPKAAVFVNSFNNPGISACVHAFIDGLDGTIYQTLPWNHRGWHCASGPKGSGNNTHIGVEMCEPANIRYTGGSTFTCSNLAAARAVVKRTYKTAVELFAYLCKKYKLDPMKDGVIISHKEGHSRGIASNHGDPEHLWKGLGLSYTMDTFRKDVKTKMSGGVSKPDVQTKPAEPEKKPAAKVPYRVRVKISNLYIRKKPTIDSEPVGFTKKGVFTITAERTGKVSKDGRKGKWGRLKSKAGWICLAFDDYTEKV